ncbi:neuropeptide FF receptor 2-like [Mya arenaria]|uniref:neuropeptide FF receptor 2-like n=1 Tax=Mya arenaria TaxID=6604 RepID=UPI0022E87DD7|nr:neuropeptide FF receptor 2-like [Mya arenaria]
MECVPGEKIPDTTDYDPHVVENYTALSLPEPIPTWEITVKIILYSAAFFCDIIGNSIVVLVIVLNKNMRSTTNVLLMNLAMSDILVGCCCMWIHLGNSITEEWPFSESACKVNTFMQVMAVTSSVLTLTAISVERFFAIVFPLKRKKSPTVIAVVVSINWLLAIGIALPQLVVRRRFEYYWKNRHEVWCTEDWPKVYDEYCQAVMPARKIYYTVVVVIMYFIPIFVMVCAYSVICVKMIQRKRPGTIVPSSRLAQDRARKKVIKMLIAVLVAFIVCWTPQQSLILWDMYRSRTAAVNPIPDYVLKIEYVAIYIAYCNSALNPILYGGFNENFRKGFNDAFKCTLWKRRNVVSPAAETNLHQRRLQQQKQQHHQQQLEQQQDSASTTQAQTCRSPVFTSTI